MKLRRAAEAEIRAAYQKARKQGMSRNQIIIEMANVMSSQMKRGVLVSRHMRSGAIDI
jgi:vacuolar-type H+-ATPase subunit E/Vma4